MVSPERLGKYELVRFLASGGMARIYLARVSGVGGFERHVVLKTVRPERIEDDAYLAMFLDEARLLATLHHQHVAQVYEVGVADDGTYFLAMEYVHGETLRSVLGRAKKTGVRVPLDFALTAVCAAASGLHHAHDRRGTDGQPLSIVHRDVSPSNIIAGYDGSVKLIDFGIAKATARSTVTQTGYVKGKAGYMSPEQALGYPVDRRTDVFALGIVLYELTTQKRAFRAATEHESVQRMVRGQVTAPSKIVPGFPPELEDIILTALEVDPDDRFGDVDGMQHAIELAAQHLGARLAPHAIARTLGDLFGRRPEPWLAGSPLSDEEDPTTATESGVRIAMAMDPPVVSESVPKITARGHAVVPPPVAAADVSPRAVVDAAVRREAAEREAEDQPTHRFFTVEEPEVAPERARSVTAPQRPPSLRNSPGPANGTGPRPSLPAIPPPIPAAPSAPMMARQATGPISAPAGHAGPSMGLAAMPRTTSPLLAPAFEPRDLRSQVEARAIALGTAPPPIAPPPGLPPVPPGASLRAASPTLGRSTTLPGVAPIGASPPSGPTTLPGIMAPRPVTSPGAAEPAPRATGSQPIARQPTGPQTPIATPMAPEVAPFARVNLPPPTESVRFSIPAPPRRRSRALVIGLVAAAVIGAGIAVLALVPGSSDVSAAPGSAAASAPPAAPPPPAKKAAAIAPTTPPAPKTVRLRVTSEPSGATVVLDGERLGTTPFDATVPARTQPATLKVRMQGRIAKKTQVSLDTDVTWDVALHHLQ